MGIGCGSKKMVKESQKRRDKGICIGQNEWKEHLSGHKAENENLMSVHLWQVVQNVISGIDVEIGGDWGLHVLPVI